MLGHEGGINLNDGVQLPTVERHTVKSLPRFYFLKANRGCTKPSPRSPHLSIRTPQSIEATRALGEQPLINTPGLRCTLQVLTERCPVALQLR